jgi:hypothetical protein
MSKENSTPAVIGQVEAYLEWLQKPTSEHPEGRLIVGESDDENGVRAIHCLVRDIPSKQSLAMKRALTRHFASHKAAMDLKVTKMTYQMTDTGMQSVPAETKTISFVPQVTMSEKNLRRQFERAVLRNMTFDIPRDNTQQGNGIEALMQILA